MPFPKTYRTALGWTISAGAAISLIAGQGTITHSAIIGLVIVGATGTIWAAWEHHWLGTKLGSCLISGTTLIAMSLLGWLAWRLIPLSPQPVSAPEPMIAVFAKCDMVALPIEIPPHDAIRIIPVNKRRMVAVNWGSLEIANSENKVKQWPEKSQLDLFRRTDYMGGDIGFKCEVSNHGNVNLLDVAMTMQFSFLTDNGGKDGGDINFTPVISPLDMNHSSVLYFFNDCPREAIAVLPNAVTVTVAGEKMKRTTKLNLPNRSPIGPMTNCTAPCVSA